MRVVCAWVAYGVIRAHTTRIARVCTAQILRAPPDPHGSGRGVPQHRAAWRGVADTSANHTLNRLSAAVS